MRAKVMTVALIVILGFSQVAAAREIVVSTFKKSSHIVVAVETIMTEAYKRLGYDITVIKIPANRSLFMANSGEVDGELFRVNHIDKVYPDLIKVPVNLYSIEMVAFTKNQFFTVDGWKSLAPYRVGYRRGIKVSELNLAKGFETVSALTYKPVFMMLAAGRCDVVVASRTYGMDIVQELELKNISILEPPLTKTGLYHYVHVKNKDLVGPLTTVLGQMGKEGLLKH
jgi:polar amino acid transport system substrate-binding protein